MKKYLVISYSWREGMDEHLDFQTKRDAVAFGRRISPDYDGFAILDKQRRKVVFISGYFPVWQLSI